MALVPALVLLGLASIASAEIVVSQVDWQTLEPNVRFHVQFHNEDLTNPSVPASGVLSSQPFGAFVPNAGQIGTFNIPPLAPDSFFDVFFDVALADLPPSAETILPGGGPSAKSATPPLCPPPVFWNGNVDVFWTPPGTGNVGYHFGELLICPGAGNSYIHVIMDCQDAAGISWNISGLCPGWSANLVSDDGNFAPGLPAPNPIPAGFFDGWLCIAADVSVSSGDTCSPSVNLTCGGVPATINVSAEACEWGTVSIEPTTWGDMKIRFEEQNDN
jgi:hypothetical protein